MESELDSLRVKAGINSVKSLLCCSLVYYRSIILNWVEHFVCWLVVGVGGVLVLGTIYSFDSEPVHRYFVWSLSATQSQTRVAHRQEHWFWSTFDCDTLKKNMFEVLHLTFWLEANRLPVTLNAIVSWLLIPSPVLIYLNVRKYCVLLNFQRFKFSWMFYCIKRTSFGQFSQLAWLLYHAPCPYNRKKCCSVLHRIY